MFKKITRQWVISLNYDGEKILVTGSSGFIGNHLQAKLTGSTSSVICFDKTEGNDVTDPAAFNNFDLQGVSTVFHLAALISIPHAWEEPAIFKKINVQGTKNVLEMCRERDIQSIVFPSTYVYGHPDYTPVDELHPVRPTNPYAETKVEGERLCHEYSEKYGLKCRVLRMFNIYGHGQVGGFLIPTIINQLNNERIMLLDSEPRRDFVYIKDVVRALLLAGQYSGGFDIFNIGSGKAHSVREVTEIIKRVYGSQTPVEYKNEKRENSVALVVSDIAKAQRMLDWTPEFDFEGGISDMRGAQN
jgi:UDP-glucose 4-epimerase